MNISIPLFSPHCATGATGRRHPHWRAFIITLG